MESPSTWHTSVGVLEGIEPKYLARGHGVVLSTRPDWIIRIRGRSTLGKRFKSYRLLRYHTRENECLGLIGI